MILGIWDGHDAGAALVDGDRVLFAVNEERLSRRKLEHGFPERSIQACIDHAQSRPERISSVAASTSDFAKTLTRCFPSLGEEYYQLRRRKKPPGKWNRLKKRAKYRLTEIPSSRLTRTISRWRLRKRLRRLGLGGARLVLVDHHTAHAAGAVFCSGMRECLAVTMDGIGDGLSGSFWSFESGRLRRLSNLDGRHSLGIFFEHVTNLLNMRELEDEGKVMALADYAYPTPDEENPLLSMFEVKGMALRGVYRSADLHQRLADILWRCPSEQFAYWAQRTLEVKIPELLRNALAGTGHRQVAYSGGVASNVKVNMRIRQLPGLERLFVFPHMGDGGLALGAALWENYAANGVSRYPFGDLSLGCGYAPDDIRECIRAYPSFRATEVACPAAAAADLICSGDIVMWFQGRMEYGPRALGNRSILALPNSVAIRDELNLRLKKRAWFQPFCPTLLERDAFELLQDYDGWPNPFMTCAYQTRPTHRDRLAGAIGRDGTCRPQIIGRDSAGPFGRLLQKIRERTGVGAVLNTSFNLHGEPMVCSPRDALETFRRTEISHLIMDRFLISKKAASEDLG